MERIARNAMKAASIVAGTARTAAAKAATRAADEARKVASKAAARIAKDAREKAARAAAKLASAARKASSKAGAKAAAAARDSALKAEARAHRVARKEEKRAHRESVRAERLAHREALDALGRIDVHVPADVDAIPEASAKEAEVIAVEVASPDTEDGGGGAGTAAYVAAREALATVRAELDAVDWSSRPLADWSSAASRLRAAWGAVDAARARSGR